MNNGVYHFNDDNFESEVLKSQTLVLVDFWAEWCMPCQFVAPAIEALANEYKGQVKIGKLNVDQNPVMPGKFGVSGIPSLILYKDGEVVDSLVGAAPKEQIAYMLNKYVSSTEKSVS